NVLLVEPRLLVQIPALAGQEIIHHDHLVTFLDKTVHEMRPDKSCPSRDKNFHGSLTLNGSTNPRTPARKGPLPPVASRLCGQPQPDPHFPVHLLPGPRRIHN